MKISKILNDELRLRKSKNKRYSMRSFARFLDMDSTALSRILNEDRLPNHKTSLKILKALNLLTPENSAHLKGKAKESRTKSKTLLLDSFENETFESLFDFHHIYVLTSLRIKAISESHLLTLLHKSCGIDEVHYQKIITDLKAIGAVTGDRPKLKVVYKNKSTVPLPFTSQKRKKMQQDFLASASKAIEKIPLEERDNATLTVAINQQDLPKIIKILRDTHIKINRVSESRKVRDAVYNICFATYPVLK